jgi:hypothetical protein
MKRYRVQTHDFDTRANVLNQKIEENWEDHIKEMWSSNKDKIKRHLLYQYGFEDAEAKLKNFLDLGPKPFSILAFHNRFADQVRHSFVIGSYYPSLVAACALGERILNHLILNLRDDFKGTPEFKKVYAKGSFDNWEVAIYTLESWGVLLPEAVRAFRELARIRNQRAIHFDPATDTDDRPLALEAIRYLDEVITSQFGTIGSQPWFFFTEGAECYIKKEAENIPFIRKIYIPNAWLVGPQHVLEPAGNRFEVRDDHEYEDRHISDEEFRNLRAAAQEANLEALRASSEER